MAIKKSDFERIADNLYIQKDYSKNKPTKFLIDFTYQRKRYRKVITIDNPLWDKRTRINEAKKRLQKYKEQVVQGKRPNEKITIERLFDLYIKNQPDTAWNRKKADYFRQYVQPHLGHIRVAQLKPFEIESLLKKMEKEGYKPRTRKLVLEVLKPLYKFAQINAIVSEDPTKFINVKIPPQKKIVIDAANKLRIIYEAITTLYKDDPYYQALFLFGFTGRRKDEVLSLRWEHIDLVNGYYWLANTKPNQQQRYPLPNRVRELLLDIPMGEKSGLVFKSPVTGKKLVNISRQIKRLKKHTGIEEFTFHYMRNVLVSAMAENGLDTPYLSGILGHTDINTINKYLTNNTFKSAEEAYSVLDRIVGQAFS